MRRGLSASCVMFVSLAAASVVVGQAYVRHGNVLDVNMRMGSGGLNRSLPGFRPGAANRIITGHVTGGHSFRAFSPVGDPSTLFGIGGTRNSGLIGGGTAVQSSELLQRASVLPSDYLSNFQRDSYNVHDYTQTDDRRVYRPYFSSSSTVTNVRSILAGLNRPGTSQIKSPYAVPNPGPVTEPTDPLATANKSPSGSLLGVSNYLMRGAGSSSDVQNGSLLGSALMGQGQFRALPIPDLSNQAKWDEALRPVGIQPVDMRVGKFEPLDRRVQPDLIDRRVGGGALGGGVGPGSVQPGEGVSPMGEAGAEGASDPGAPDVYSAMDRRSGGTLARPYGRLGDAEEGEPGSALLRGRSALAQPTPLAEIRGQVEAGPEATKPPRLQPADMLAQPLKTFVGSEQTQLNKYLAEAEALLHAGRYYQAAGYYDLARMVAPDSPLPPLGRAMSLLAAGEYLTSANNLFRAIRLFDSADLYNLDMKAFIPDLTMLDRRRADLERRLERHEIFKLRFLLGYAEYCSGLEKLGLANLEKAVADAPKDLSHLRKFIDTLRARHPDLTHPIDVDSGS